MQHVEPPMGFFVCYMRFYILYTLSSEAIVYCKACD